MAADLAARWRARRLLVKTRHLADEQRMDEALETAHAAVTLDPDSPGVRLQKALLHLDRGEPQDALALLTTDPQGENPAWPVFTGLAYADAGDLEKAREHLRQGLKMQPENRLARGLQATVWLRAGKPEQAVRVLDKSGIEASPRLLGRLLVEVERTLTRMGVSEGSRLREVGVVQVDRAVSESEAPSEGEVLSGLAAPQPMAPAEGASLPALPQCLEPADGEVDEAPLPWDPPTSRQGLLDRLVGAVVDPIFAQTCVGRAEKRLIAQRPTEALAAAREAVRRYPDVPRGFCMLGLAYLHAGHPREALRCLEEAALHDGETPDVLYAQGCCWHESGDLQKARERLEKMLAAFAKDAAAHYTIGQIDLEEGRELDARRRFEHAAFLDFLLVRERVQRLKTALLKNVEKQVP